jgi:hypothetical protein
MLGSPFTGWFSVGLEPCGVLMHPAWFARYSIGLCKTL